MVYVSGKVSKLMLLFEKDGEVWGKDVFGYTAVIEYEDIRSIQTLPDVSTPMLYRGEGCSSPLRI